MARTKKTSSVARNISEPALKVAPLMANDVRARLCELSRSYPERMRKEEERARRINDFVEGFIAFVILMSVIIGALYLCGVIDSISM